jgi:hypothetical protein
VACRLSSPNKSASTNSASSSGVNGFGAVVSGRVGGIWDGWDLIGVWCGFDMPSQLVANIKRRYGGEMFRLFQWFARLCHSIGSRLSMAMKMGL